MTVVPRPFDVENAKERKVGGIILRVLQNVATKELFVLGKFIQ